VRVLARCLLIAFAVFGVCGVAVAVQQEPAVELTEITPAVTGWIGVQLSGPIGATVTISEGATPLRTVTLTAPLMQIPRLVPWRCDQRVRRLEAQGAQLTAAITIRTPSCAQRFGVRLRPRTAVRRGHALAVTLVDRWRTGATAARTCLRVGRASACRQAVIPAGSRGLTLRLRAPRAGVGQVSVSSSGFTVRERLEVRAAGAPLRVLATGDSMIQIIDSLLAQRLTSGRVTSDARISTGISKPFMFDWVRHARGEAHRVRPQVTVMFIGANDGFAIGKAPCCGAGWIRAYARRVAKMMGDYRRGGAGRVYWLTIPTPRDPKRKSIYEAVNQAIKRAAARFPPDEVSVLDLVPVFTPGGVFRSSIHGRVVRQADGIHLNVAGARIAANLIVKRLRADGISG
jgi:lysophospholipase L1-like esterase